MTVAKPDRVVSFADASRMVREQAESLAAARPVAQENVSLLGCLGRVLAEPVVADRDQPPFPRSTRDGYACAAADLRAQLPLRISGSLRAGEAPGTDGQNLVVGKGEAVEIMTGAPVPAGADCVVMVEHTRCDGDLLHVCDDRRREAGENIVAQAAEARAGAVVVASGTRLAAQQIGAAASCGLAELSVHVRPRVSIIATGDELVELDCRPLAHQIRNSNSYSLAAQVLAAGAEPLRLPIARDERAGLESVIRTGLQNDLLLLSGGVSMGKYDLVEEVLLALGAEFYFTGALIQPGKPVVFGRLPLRERTVYFFGLPGNPVSAMVTFLLFARPLLAALGGEVFRGPHYGWARLARQLEVKAGLTRFLPAKLHTEGIEVMVETVAWQGSGDLAAASRADCFVVVPADRLYLAAGETVTVLLA